MDAALAAVLLGFLIPLATGAGNAASVCGRVHALMATCIRGPHPATAGVILRASSVPPDITSDVRRRRLRFFDRELQVAADRGARRSPTFARLLNGLANSDLIVQVQFRPDRRPGAGSRLLMGPVTSGGRFIRIEIEPAVGRDRLITQLGHELFHAVEVAAAPEVRSARALAALYRRIGFQRAEGDPFDTDEAHRVESIIRGELLTPACRSPH